MGMFGRLGETLFRAMGGLEPAPKPGPERLPARTLQALGRALDRLGLFRTGWISLEDYSELFARPQGEAGPSRLEGEALNAMGQFAAAHRCEPRVDRSERRIYFSKDTL